MRFEVIIACHNRRDLTVESIGRFSRSAVRLAEVGFTVLDDGSTDGTSDALLSMREAVTIARGDGKYFWARGMAQAEAEVLLTARDEDWIVWLNDDVVLDADALSRFVDAASQAGKESIFVGSMRDPESGRPTYGGLRRAGVHPLRFDLIQPSRDAVSADAMNGNLVFLRAATARRMGGIDGAFSHALADIDYGLRARKMGIDLIVLPGTFGSCARNASPPPVSIWEEWRRFIGVKGGGNPRSTRRFLRRHSRYWLIPYLATYILWWSRRLPQRLISALRNQA
jgi:GT2 family glycosyltransferase